MTDYSESKMFINFDTHFREGIDNIEVKLPTVPRIGELIDAEVFLDPDDQQFYIDRDQGSFYVRNVWHNLRDGVQNIIIEVALTKQDDFYSNRLNYSFL